MTELEKIQRARMYIDKLANGINPIDNTEVPEGDVINNVRLSRCFFFVSDVLRQVIENGGVSPAAKNKKSSKKLPLVIPFEKREQFHYSEQPIPVSEIAKRVNEFVDDERMKKLTYPSILSWLTEAGLLEWTVTPEGKHTKHPTEAGKENGISVEERMGSNGPYQAAVYNRDAQHLIIDNLDAVIAAENQLAEMQGTPWTKEQDKRLMELYREAVPMGKIAAELKRSTSAVHGRLKRLGLAGGKL